jgi:hypothetical protein
MIVRKRKTRLGWTLRRSLVSSLVSITRSGVAIPEMSSCTKVSIENQFGSKSGKSEVDGQEAMWI